MKRLILLLLLTNLLISCDNSAQKYNMAVEQFNQENYESALSNLSSVKTNDETLAQKSDSLRKEIIKEQYLMSYEGMKEHRNDTTFLNFILGSSKKEVSNHISKLLKQKKIKNKTSYTFNLGFGEFKQQVELSGYEIDFYPDDYSCKGLIKLNYFDEKLSSIEITLFDAPEGESIVLDVNQMFENKYGSTKKHSAFYNSEDSKYFYSFWRESNQAIYISKVSNFVTINYVDLIAKYNKETLLNDLKDLKKENDSIKSKDTEKII